MGTFQPMNGKYLRTLKKFGNKYVNTEATSILCIGDRAPAARHPRHARRATARTVACVRCRVGVTRATAWAQASRVPHAAIPSPARLATATAASALSYPEENTSAAAGRLDSVDPLVTGVSCCNSSKSKIWDLSDVMQRVHFHLSVKPNAFGDPTPKRLLEHRILLKSARLKCVKSFSFCDEEGRRIN